MLSSIRPTNDGLMRVTCRSLTSMTVGKKRLPGESRLALNRCTIPTPPLGRRPRERAGRILRHPGVALPAAHGVLTHASTAGRRHGGGAATPALENADAH